MFDWSWFFFEIRWGISNFFAVIWQVILKVILLPFKLLKRVLKWIADWDWSSILNVLFKIFSFPFIALGLFFGKIIDFIKWFLETFANAISWSFKTIFKIIKWFFEAFGDVIVWCIKLMLYVVTLRFLFGSDEDNKKKSMDLFDRLFPKSEK